MSPGRLLGTVTDVERKAIETLQLQATALAALSVVPEVQGDEALRRQVVEEREKVEEGMNRWYKEVLTAHHWVAPEDSHWSLIMETAEIVLLEASGTHQEKPDAIIRIPDATLT